MASVSSNPKTHGHVRSISLPSRSIQVSEVEEQLCRFQDSEGTSSSSSSISQKINGLTDLYVSIDNLLLLPSNQRSLAQECQNNLVNELLDGLLRLLDLCSSATDALSMTRESAQELQSALRRKRGDNSGLMSAIQEYQSQKKNVRKAIHKALRYSPKSGNKRSSSSSEVASVLKKVESVSSTVFESLFSVINGSKSQSLVSKLFASKHIMSCDQTLERALMEKVDGELFRLMISQKVKNQSYSCFQVENTQKQLLELESSFQDVEEGLECLHRHLIKTRVSLLNLLNC